MKTRFTSTVVATAGVAALAGLASPAHAVPGVYYKNCDAAIQAQAAPILAGEPGYRLGLDRDKDGVACDKNLPAGYHKRVVATPAPSTPASPQPTRPGTATQAPAPTKTAAAPVKPSHSAASGPMVQTDYVKADHAGNDTALFVGFGAVAAAGVLGLRRLAKR